MNKNKRLEKYINSEMDRLFTANKKAISLCNFVLTCGRIGALNGIITTGTRRISKYDAIGTIDDLVIPSSAEYMVSILFHDIKNNKVESIRIFI